MPKQRITKEMVVDAAFEIARKGGMEHVIVKNIAEKLGCSVQPIYSYCTNMEGLRTEVEQKARQFLQAYLEAHSDPQDLFRSTGHAYLQLAKEEPHILSIFVLQKRANVSSIEDLYQLETNPQVAQKDCRRFDYQYRNRQTATHAYAHLHDRNRYDFLSNDTWYSTR